MFSKKVKTAAKVAWFLTISSMKKNKKLNILVIGVLAFSFLNVVFFESITSGMSDAINGQLIDLVNGHITIEPLEQHRYVEDWRTVRNKLLAFPEVEAASPELGRYFEVRKKDKFRPSYINGIDPETFVQVKRIQDKIIAGSFLEPNDYDYIVIGSDIAGGIYEKDSILGGVRIEADVGDKVILTAGDGKEYELKVKGIYRTAFLGLDIECFVPMKKMEEMLNASGRADLVGVRIYNKDDSTRLKTEMINAGIDGKVTSWEENAGFSRSVTNSLGLVSKITGFIGVLTAFVTVFIVIYIKTKNQRSQIATLRAVGISDKAIIGSYVFEALSLGIIGIVIGVIVMKIMLIYFAAHPLGLPIGDVVPIMTQQTQWVSILILVFATIIAGYYPTKRVLKENIIEAIRGGG
jgi:putative ABC transport system permease protein